MVLTNYSAAHLVRVLPQAVLFSIGDLVINLLAFRLVKATDVVRTWTWSLAHLPRTLRIRKQMSLVRRAPDSEVRNFQVGGSARVTAFIRGTVVESAARINTGARQSRTVMQRLREGPSQVAAISGLLVGLVLLIGSRGIIFGTIPVVREFSTTDASWSSMLQEYWDGWRTTGLGATAATPTLVGVMGTLSTVLFGGEGLVRNLLIVGCLPAGVAGAWWMARGGSSSRTRALMMVAYSITPVPYNAMAEGRWGALGLWAGLPWMVGLLGRSAAAMPFAGSQFRTIRGLRATVALGLVTAAVTTVLPVAPVLLLVCAGVLSAVGLVDRSDLARWERAVPAALGASAITFAIHLPWALGLLTPLPQWGQLVGPAGSAGGPVPLRDLVWFDTGPNSVGFVLIGLHLAGAFAVVVGREWRFRLAVQGWALALTGWVLAWMGEAQVGPSLPVSEVLLVLPVLGLAVAIGAGLAAFERDVTGSDFGFRQVFSMLSAGLMVVASVAWVARAIDGRWGLPEEDHLAVVGTLESRAPDAQYRTLWLGDGDVLPLGSWELNNGSNYATTEGLFPEVGDWFAGPKSDGTEVLGDALNDAVAGRTTRLGKLLGSMGVRYVVVARSGAPLAFDKARVEPPDSTVDALDQQLDLARLSVSESLFIYDNAAFTPEVAQLPAGTLEDSGDDLSAVLATDLSKAEAVLPTGDRFIEGRGPVTDETELYVARSRDANWKLNVGDASTALEPAFGWAGRAEISGGGQAVLAYSPPLIRTLLVVLQITALLAAINAVRRRRVGASDPRNLRQAFADRRERVKERRERRASEPLADAPVLPTSELPTIVVEGEQAPPGDVSPGETATAKPTGRATAPAGPPERFDDASAVEVSPADPASAPEPSPSDTQVVEDPEAWDPGEIEPDWLAEPPRLRRRRRRNVVLPDDATPPGADADGAETQAVAHEHDEPAPGDDPEGGPGKGDPAQGGPAQGTTAPEPGGDDGEGYGEESHRLREATPAHPAGSGRSERPRLRLVRGRRDKAAAKAAQDSGAEDGPAAAGSPAADEPPGEGSRVVRRRTRREPAQPTLFDDGAAGIDEPPEDDAAVDEPQGDQP